MTLQGKPISALPWTGTATGQSSSPGKISVKHCVGLTSCSSPDGGVDIEEVAERTPERIKKVPVDIHTGVTDEMATELAKFLGFKGELVPQCAEQIKNLYTMFLDVDCLQLEVNPLAETPQGKVSCILIKSSGIIKSVMDANYFS